jgi:hypothetical protein
MFFKKISKISLMAATFGMVGAGTLQATPEQDFQTSAVGDYQKISDYVNGKFANSMGFFTSLGWNTPSGVFDLLSGPRVELGVGAGADVVSIPSLGNLSLSAINLNSNVSIPAVVPVPFPVITGRVGLMNGLDLGLKVNYLPLVSIPEVGFSANYFGWGLDLRYKILSGVYVPDVTVGVSWDTMSGSFSLATSINQTGSYFDSGTSTTYSNITFSGNNNYTLNWDTKSFGAQLQVGKDLGAIFPFAAVGFQRNSGTISSSMVGTGTLTIPPPGSNTVTPVNLNVTSNAIPVAFEPKFALGFDMGGGLHWAVVGESNGIDIAGSTSFRVQF